ncbi:MAG: hypothetical protein HUU20_26395, partial [Pirellulales bacterium]|nr:hypothetical protein [Pirellulales bacterium]
MPTSAQTSLFDSLDLPPDLRDLLRAAPSVMVPTSREDLFALALGTPETNPFEVA